MSTRANIKLIDDGDELWFYRHSDGYPSGTLPTLQIFVGWLNDNSIRSNVSQGGGWLIMIGAKEYGTDTNWQTGEETEKDITNPTNWKIGAYEPTTRQHGDIEYLYTIDMLNKKIHIHSMYGDSTETLTFEKFLDMKSKDFERIEKITV